MNVLLNGWTDVMAHAEGASPILAKNYQSLSDETVGVFLIEEDVVMLKKSDNSFVLVEEFKISDLVLCRWVSVIHYDCGVQEATVSRDAGIFKLNDLVAMITDYNNYLK